MKATATLSRWLRFQGWHTGWAAHGVLRGLGAIYFFSFWSLAAQAPALFGPSGLTPMGTTLNAVREKLGAAPWLAYPTLFWISDSENMLIGVLALGALGGLFLFLGRAPWWAALCAWTAHVSLLHAAGPWMHFQADALLAELGFVALFLASPRWTRLPRPSETSRRLVGILMCNFLLFKVMFGSGWVKLTGGDPFWMRETALHVFFETQPLPLAAAWFMHQLPGAVLRHLLWAVVFIEITLPFYMFMPRVFRSIAAGGFACLMLFLLLTGNHGFYPWLVLLLSLTLLDDRTWREWLPGGKGPAPVPRDLVERRPDSAALTWLALWIPVCLASIWNPPPQHIPPPWRQTSQVLQAAASSNTFGMFRNVHPRRFEIEIQGSVDGRHWREYLFKSKPGHPQRLPLFPGAHFPRLDRVFHDLAGGVATPGSYREHPWLSRLAEGLLVNDPQTLSLLEVNPFPDHPPVYLRFVIYQVRYADPVTRRERGVWWVRSAQGLYAPVVRRAPQGE